jgi:8-oxo-dGTP pyrophosphatase MutT (NUDIX family)
MPNVQSWLAHRDLRPDAAPPMLERLIGAIGTAKPRELSRNDPLAIEVAERQAAVLILLATDQDTGPDVLLQERAASLADHAGEISFPGGSREPGDVGPVDTALREATEETGLDASGVDPLVILPRLHIPPSRFDVSGVLAHWRAPSPVAPADPAETRRTMRIPLLRLADPANHLLFEHPSGWRGPAFSLGESIVWGYTGEILAAVLRFGGWEQSRSAIR